MIFPETYAIMPPTGGFGFKNRNFRGFSPDQEVGKTIFGLRWSRLPHDLKKYFLGITLGNLEYPGRQGRDRGNFLGWMQQPPMGALTPGSAL